VKNSGNELNGRVHGYLETLRRNFCPALTREEKTILVPDLIKY